MPIREDEEELRRDLIENAVLRNCAERAGVEAAKQWNETVGEVLSRTAPVD